MPFDPLLPDALIKIGLNAKDALQDVTPIIVRRALEGETPQFYVGFGESGWNNGVVFSDERGAKWSAAENWTCFRDLCREVVELKCCLGAEHVPFCAYDGDYVMINDDQVCDANDAQDDLRDDDRCWAWAAEEDPFRWDPEEALDDHLADWWDEANAIIPASDMLPLRQAWASILAKHGPSLSRYSEDRKRLVVYNEVEFAREIMEWTERLALCEAAIARIRAEGAPATHLLHVTTLVARIAHAIKREWR